MTRPPPESVTDTRSVPVFLAGFLKEAGLLADDRAIYEFGKPVGFFPKGKKASEETITLSEFISENWQIKLRIRPRAPEVWDINDPGQGNRWGNLVHLVLSEIGSAADLDRVLNDLSSSGWVDDNDRVKLAGAVRAVIEGPETARFFAEGVKHKSEAEILLTDGRSIRPDRVIMENDHLVLVDYKTGKPLENHERQIRRYGGILETMGYQDIRKYLIYISPEVKLIEVSDG